MTDPNRRSLLGSLLLPPLAIWPMKAQSAPSNLNPLSDRQIVVLDDLKNGVNLLYGYKDFTPRVNLGPCGRFARDFRVQWYARFKQHLNIVFIMNADRSHCYHVLVRMPDGSYFDGGNGLIPGRVLLRQYDFGTHLDEMVKFDYGRLDQMSYGLERKYTNCPNYSDSDTNDLITAHLGILPA